MTEEQIKQNAEAYADENYNCIRNGSAKWYASKESFIAGSHSRDEEIKELLKDREKFYREKISALADAQELRNELDQLRNPWISVEERLPEDNQVVFVHMQGGSCDSALYTNGVFERNLQLRFGMKDDGYTIISWEQKFKSNITHWMPIPELKKGE